MIDIKKAWFCQNKYCAWPWCHFSLDVGSLGWSTFTGNFNRIIDGLRTSPTPPKILNGRSCKRMVATSQLSISHFIIRDKIFVGIANLCLVSSQQIKKAEFIFVIINSINKNTSVNKKGKRDLCSVPCLLLF